MITNVNYKRNFRMLVDAREHMADRFKPGGDKYESIKSDLDQQKSHDDHFICDGCCEPKETTDICWDDNKLYCFECFDAKEKIIDISEEK